MRKIALISDGWKRLVTYSWVDGIMSYAKESGEEICLYHFNTNGNWSRDRKYNNGEYNLYTLPNYEEYDGRFLYACASESEDLVVRLAFDRICYPQGLTKEAKDQYCAYLREHLPCLYRYMAEEKDVRQVQKYLETFAPDREEIQSEIEAMQKGGFSEAVPYLMAYHHEHFAGKRHTFSL